MAVEQESAMTLQTHTITPQRSAIIEMALRAEIRPGQKPLFPPLPYRNLQCLWVNCAGLLWSSRCEAPINWLYPHEGIRCPYCNGSLLIHWLGKDWPPSQDSLYRVLGHEQLKSCDTCGCWL